jgi:hypothetical protein
VTALRISVVTSCTSQKTPAGWPPLSRDDFARGLAHLDALHRERPGALVEAERLYRGQQHVRLMHGVDAARAAGHEVDVSIISAGYGLVDGSEPLAPYECTFQGMPATRRRAWARQLGLPAAMREQLAEPADATVILLGSDYLDACELSNDLVLGAPTVVVCGARTALRLPPIDAMRVVILREEDTRRFGCGLVGLKGEIGGRLLSVLAGTPDALPQLLGDDLVGQLAASGSVARSTDLGLF